MMRKGIFLGVTIGLCLTVLTGCWDIQSLTNKKLVNGISLDASGNNQLKGSVRVVLLESKGSGQFDAKDEVMEAVGTSTYNLGIKIDDMLPGSIEATKTHVIIIGEELAKKGIMSPLEYLYRNPRGYLNTNIVISKGTASEILAFKQLEKSPVAFSILQMIEGAKHKTVVPNQTMYSLWSQISETGADAVLPMIHKVNDKALAVDSIGLFDGDKYTGVSLSGGDNTILLLLMGKLNKLAYMVIPIEQNSIAFEVQKLKRSMKVSVDQKTAEIECRDKLDLYISINSYPSFHKEIDREQLKKEIAAWLNKEAIAVTDKLLQANCDALGIGRKLRVAHPGLWKTIDWKEKYKDVQIKPEFQIHITNTGLIK